MTCRKEHNQRLTRLGSWGASASASKWLADESVEGAVRGDEYEYHRACLACRINAP